MKRLIAALLLAAPTAEASTTILPGYWESANSVGFPAPSHKVDRRCITEKDVDKFVQGPRNHIWDCDYPEHEAADGHLSFRGRCVDKKGLAVRISGHGDYSPTTLRMFATVNIGPLAVEASTDAHRIGDVCPAGAPGGSPDAPLRPAASGR